MNIILTLLVSYLLQENSKITIKMTLQYTVDVFLHNKIYTSFLFYFFFFD